MSLFKYIKSNVIAGVLIFSIFISPIAPLTYVFANAVTSEEDQETFKAETGAGKELSGNTGDEGDQIKEIKEGNIGDTASALTASVLGCGNSSKRFKRSIRDLASLYDSGTQLYDTGLTNGTQALTDTISTGLSAYEDISGFITDINKEVSDKKQQKLQKQTNAELKKQTEAIEDRALWEECLNGIAYKVTKHQLATMTQKTINWVNSGFQGDPLFVKDNKTFFKDLADKQLSSFLVPLTSPANQKSFPFGRDLAKSLINDAGKTFEQKAQSTLKNALKPGATTESFSKDFSQGSSNGGWGGWFSLTQNPQNNPLGFGLLATQKLQKDTAQAEQEKRDQLNQGRGYLSDQKCVEWSKSPESNLEIPAGDEPSKKGDISVISKGTGLQLGSFDVSRTGVLLSLSYSATENGTLTINLKTQAGAIEQSKVLGNFSGPGKQTFNASFSGLTAGSSHNIEINFKKIGPVIPTEVGKLLLVTAEAPVVITGGQKETGSGEKDTNNHTDEVCTKYETITPGSTIEALINTQLTSPIRQLEVANTINQSLDQVFSSLLNQLSTKGFSSLSSFATKSNYIKNNSTGGSNPVRYYNSLGQLIQVSKGHGGWYSSGQDFDITRDLDDIFTKDATGKYPVDVNGKKIPVKKGVITVQEEYLKAILLTRASLNPILPAIGKLDYCIPGPNPGWLNRTKQRITETIEYMSDKEFGSNNVPFTPAWTSGNSFGTFTGIGAVVGSIIPGVGNAVGAVVGLVIDLGFMVFDKIKDDKNKQIALELEKQKLTAEKMYYENRQNEINSFGPTLEEYVGKIREKYDPILDSNPTNNKFLPMAPAGIDIVKNIDTYDSNIKQAYKDYDQLTAETKSNIAKLKIIKVKVDAIVKTARKRQQNRWTAAQNAKNYATLNGLSVNSLQSYTDTTTKDTKGNPDPTTLTGIEIQGLQACQDNTILDIGTTGFLNTFPGSPKPKESDIIFTATTSISANVGPDANNPTACIQDLILIYKSDVTNHTTKWEVTTATGKGLLVDPATIVNTDTWDASKGINYPTGTIPIDALIGAGTATAKLITKGYDTLGNPWTIEKTKKIKIPTMTKNSSGKACTTTKPDFNTTITAMSTSADQCYSRIAVTDKSISPYGIKSYTWDANFDGNNTGIILNKIPGSSTFIDGVASPVAWIDTSKINGSVNGGKALLDITLKLKDNNGTIFEKKNRYDIYKTTKTPNGNACPVTKTPDEPTNLIASAVSNNKASLSWTAPTSTGGHPIIDYTVEYSSTGTGNWTVFNDGVSKTTSTNVTGLTNGQTYYFRVSAENILGVGNPSNTITTKGNSNVTIDFDLTSNKTTLGTCDVSININNKNTITGATSYTWTFTSIDTGNSLVYNQISSKTISGDPYTTQPQSPAFKFNAHHSYGKATIDMLVTGPNGLSKTLQKKIDIAQINDNGFGGAIGTCY